MNPESKSHWLITLGLAVGLMLVGFASYMQATAIKQQNKKIDMIVQALSGNGSTSTAPVTMPSDENDKVVSQKSVELVTGKFTFKHVCKGELKLPTATGDSDAPPAYCIGTNELVVVRDERASGIDSIAETVVVTKQVARAEDAYFLKEVEVVPVMGEAYLVLVDFEADTCLSTGDCGVCMGSGFGYAYDSVSPGELKLLRNYPPFGENGIWAAGVLAYVPGCTSGAGYPVGSVMVYDPERDTSVRVTESEAVPPGLWTEADIREGGPTDAIGRKLPYWSDLKFNETTGFSIIYTDVNGTQHPYYFNNKGEDTTEQYTD